MNILIAVHDLTIEKWHLMPWRTVVEVVNGLNTLGHNAILLSLDSSKEMGVRAFEDDVLPKGTLAVNKHKDFLSSNLSSVIELHHIDIVFWPVTWREPRWRTRVVAEQNICNIGWYPGGVYGVTDVLYALRKMGLRKTLAYIVEAVYPKRIQMAYMKKAGINGLLTMTHFTKSFAVNNGWPDKQAYTVLPGKETLDQGVQNISDEVTRWLGGKPFILFMGPPSAIRGVYEVLSAFEQTVKDNDQGADSKS